MGNECPDKIDPVLNQIETKLKANKEAKTGLRLAHQPRNGLPLDIRSTGAPSERGLFPSRAVSDQSRQKAVCASDVSGPNSVLGPNVIEPKRIIAPRPDSLALFQSPAAPIPG